MSFSSFKNWSPIYFYFVSIISFVTANMIRDKNLVFYYILLILGIVFFVLGLTKRIKKQ